MEYSKYYTEDYLIPILQQLNFPNKSLIVKQAKEFFKTPLKIANHIKGNHSLSLYCVLPSSIYETTVNVHFVMQIFVDYPNSAPKIYLYAHGDFIPNSELSFVHQDGEYFYVDIPYLKTWNQTNTLGELTIILATLLEKQCPIKLLIPIIKYSDIIITDLIGVGVDGTVYKVKYHNSTYALKKYSVSFLSSDCGIEETNRRILESNNGNKTSTITQSIPTLSKSPSLSGKTDEKNELYRKQLRMRREISIHACLNSPYIVKIYGICETDNHTTGVLLEKCRHTMLYILLTPKYILNINMIHNWINNIMEAIIYIHDQNVLHRDIKADNILINNNNIAKLCDFGFARTYNPDSTVSILGTPTHVAPEILEGKQYSNRVDIYSFGILLIELFTRMDMNDYLRKFRTNEELFEDLYHYMDSLVLKIVKLCLKHEPSERPNMKSIRNYFDKVNWSQIHYYRSTL